MKKITSQALKCTFLLFSVFFAVSMAFNVFGSTRDVAKKSYLGGHKHFNSIERPLVASSLFEECRGIDPSTHKIDEKAVHLRKTCLIRKNFSTSLPEICNGVDTSGPALKHHNDKRFIVPNCLATHAHIIYLEKKLTEVCNDAGEKIFKTVDGVKDVFIDTLHRDRLGLLHSRELNSYSYRDTKTGRHINIQTKSSSQYGIKIVPLLTKIDNQHGLYGSKLTIYNRRTNEILAQRSVFYFVISNHLKRADGKTLYLPRPIPSAPYYVASCPNYPLKYDARYKDGVPRNSFEFISRVFRP